MEYNDGFDYFKVKRNKGMLTCHAKVKRGETL